MGREEESGIFNPAERRRANADRVHQMGLLQQVLHSLSPPPSPAPFNQLDAICLWKEAWINLPLLLQSFIQGFLLVLQQPLEMFHFPLVLSSPPRKFLLSLCRFEADVPQLACSGLFIHL